MRFLELARMKAKEIDLDDYWLEEILLRLSKLHMAGSLPDLLTCPLWVEVDRHWQVKSLDVAESKGSHESGCRDL